MPSACAKDIVWELRLLLNKEDDRVAKLIKCSDCRKKISARAESCPNCGAPVNAQASAKRQYSLAGFASGLLVVACLIIGIGWYQQHTFFSIFSFVVAIVLIKPVRGFIASKTPKPNLASPLIYLAFASLWTYGVFTIAGSTPDYLEDIKPAPRNAPTVVAPAPAPAPASAPAQVPVPVKEPTQPSPIDMWVTSDRLQRYTCPDTGCGAVGAYFFREKATVLEERGDWVRVSKYYDASCRGGVSDYVDSGNSKCEAANGIENGQFAEWAIKANLAAKRPADPAAGAKGAYELVSGSDDYARYKDAFAKAAASLISSGRCTAKHFRDNAGWTKSMSQKDKPVYFTYCGNYEKVYLDASTGKVTY